MAIDTISQIKIDNTTYDFCDYEIRSKLVQWLSVTCRVSSSSVSLTVPAGDLLSFSWGYRTSSVSDYTYWGYLNYNLGSAGTDNSIYAVTLTEGGMVVANANTTSDKILSNPEASLLYSADNSLTS